MSPAIAAERLSEWLPLFGVGTALTLYWVAAACYSESVIAGRPWAQVATVLLPVSLVPLWWRVPVLFRAGFTLGRWVAPAGALAVLSLAGVGTSHHDAALNVGAVSGFTALALTITGIDRKRHRDVVAWTLLAGSLTGANYALWVSKCVHLAPLVQKCALVATVAWVMVTFAALRRVVR